MSTTSTPLQVNTAGFEEISTSNGVAFTFSSQPLVGVYRLHKEFVALQKAKPRGITLSLVSDNLHLWRAIIPGPTDSLYEGGKFTAHIVIPENYPLKPPTVNFDTDTIPYHLNIDQTVGQVCLGFLTEDNWSPAATSMEQIVNALFALLARPEPENSMDHSLINEYTHYSSTYNTKARESAKKCK